jgi:hypothetical protein
MKKNILLVFIFLLSFFEKAISQNSNDIYIEALTLYIKNLQQNVKKSTTITPLPKYLYLKDLSSVTYKFPDTIENIKLIILSDSQIKKIVGKKKTLYIIRINPISITDQQCFLFIGDYDVSYKNNRLNYESLGGMKISIDYDCSKKIYIPTIQ